MNAEIAPVEEPIRWMIAKSDIRTDRNGIKSMIRAGQLVRADDVVVREAPGAFYESTRYVFHADISEFNRDTGQYIRKITNRMELDHLPPPGDDAEDHWRRFWGAQLRKEGRDPWDVEVERIEGTTYIVRGSISRAVPPAPQIIVQIPEQPPPTVVVNVDSQPATAIVEFTRDPDGRPAKSPRRSASHRRRSAAASGTGRSPASVSGTSSACRRRNSTGSSTRRSSR